MVATINHGKHKSLFQITSSLHQDYWRFGSVANSLVSFLPKIHGDVVLEIHPGFLLQAKLWVMKIAGCNSAVLVIYCHVAAHYGPWSELIYTGANPKEPHGAAGSTEVLYPHNQEQNLALKCNADKTPTSPLF